MTEQKKTELENPDMFYDGSRYTSYMTFRDCGRYDDAVSDR